VIRESVILALSSWSCRTYHVPIRTDIKITALRVTSFRVLVSSCIPVVFQYIIYLFGRKNTFEYAVECLLVSGKISGL